MSLTLCSTPDQLYCAQNVELKYYECLPQCSGVWLMSYEKTEMNKYDRIKKLTDQIKDLTKQYWNFKGFYEFPKNLSNNIVNPKYKQGKGRCEFISNPPIPTCLKFSGNKKSKRSLKVAMSCT